MGPVGVRIMGEDLCHPKFRKPDTQKHPPEVFYENNCSSKFRNIHRKTPVLESLFKKRLQRRFFSANIAKFIRTPIMKNICERLLLNN